MDIKSCRVCGSYAINEHLHGRIPGAKPDLCDVCYWREVALEARATERLPKRELSVEESIILGLANSLGFHVALVPMRNEEMEDLENGTYINHGIVEAKDGFSNDF